MLRRHVLLVLAALAPAGALAQTAGTITFSENDEFINAAECNTANNRTVRLSWTLQQDAGFVAGGTLRVYATNKDPAQTAAPNQGYCAEGDDSSTSTKAGPIGEAQGGAVTTLEVSTATLATVAGYTDCTDAIERPVFVCVHYRNPSGGARAARASGEMTLQVAAPGKPTLTSVTPGDGRLFASWTAPTGGATAARYVLTATPSGGTAIRSGEIVGTSGTVEGLANGTAYAVQVIALSSGRNEGPPSDALTGTPAPTQGFWDTYEDQGGVEEGGCQTGAAGALALLGLAALALGRRRS